MADLTLTVTNRTIAFPQTVPQQITNTEYIDRVKFNCDSEYTGYSLVALFKNGTNGKVFPVAVPADRGFVDIDPRALRRKGYLYIGMYGLNGLKVLPTLWATPIEIKEGVDTSATEDPSAPVPSVYAALVARVGALETAVEALEDDVDALDVAVDELDEDVEDLQTTVAGKQDTIPDLDTIRSGAALGATALQSVPMATQNVIGGGKVNTVQGIGMKADGTFYAESASNANITNRNNGFRPIVSTNMDLAFRTCITAPSQELTDEQKAAACATIGAGSKSGTGWTHIGTMTNAELLCNLEGYTEIMIKGETIGTGTSNFFAEFLDNTNAYFVVGICKNGKRRFVTTLSDTPFGVAQTFGKYADDVTHWTMTTQLNGGACVTNNRVTNVYKLYFGTPANLTSCNIEVYAR